MNAILFQESYLKELGWPWVWAASHFLFRKKSQTGRSRSVSLGNTVLCSGSVSESSPPVLLYTLPSSSRAWSSLRHVKVLPAEELFLWYRLSLSVESVFLLPVLCQINKIKKRDEVGSLGSQPASCSPNMKNDYLVWSPGGWTWTNPKHTGTASPNQIIRVCNPITTARLSPLHTVVTDGVSSSSKSWGKYEL